MTPENFIYWLNGFFELSPANQGLSAEQVQVIKNHLSLAFKKVTPEVKIPQYSPPYQPTFDWQDNSICWSKAGTNAPLKFKISDGVENADKRIVPLDFNGNPMPLPNISGEKAWNLSKPNSSVGDCTVHGGLNDKGVPPGTGGI